MTHHTGCLLCGTDLLHHDESQSLTCSLCGEREPGFFSCPKSHYICNSCHSKRGVVAILSHCRETTETDPGIIAEQLMEDPTFAMHGPEHHALVGAALITAIKNATGKASWTDVMEVVRRGAQVPGGFCGLYGACGAGISAGVAASVLTKATPVKAEGRALANRVTAAALAAIAEMGGVRCCKASTRKAMETSVEILAEALNFPLTAVAQGNCMYPRKNRQCNGTSCPYFPS